MHEPDVPPSLARPRRAIVALIGLALLIAIAATLHDRAIARSWTNALGVLLGSLAGTFIGEGLERFRDRAAAVGIAWILTAGIGLALVAVISWQALPAYCQLPVSFVAGALIVTATVYIQRLRIGGSSGE